MSVSRKAKTKYAVPELGRSPNRRPTRVAEAIRGELSMLFLQKVKDLRLAEVSITKVEVPPDMRSAFVYFNCPEGEMKPVEAGLASSRGFMRSHLAKVLNLRYMPELIFKYDLSAVRQAEMDRILREIANELHASERDNQGDPES
jgi:ribosome-binding factor A